MKVWKGLKDDYRKILLYQDGIKVEFNHHNEDFFFIFAGMFFFACFVFFWCTL